MGYHGAGFLFQLVSSLASLALVPLGSPGAVLLLRPGNECQLQKGPGRPSEPGWRQAGEEQPADSLSGVCIDLRGQRRGDCHRREGRLAWESHGLAGAHFCLQGLAVGSLPCSEDTVSSLRTKPTFPAALPRTHLCSRFSLKKQMSRALKHSECPLPAGTKSTPWHSSRLGQRDTDPTVWTCLRTQLPVSCHCVR